MKGLLGLSQLMSGRGRFQQCIFNRVQWHTHTHTHIKTHTCLTETWSLISSCTRLIQWPQQWLHQHLQKTYRKYLSLSPFFISSLYHLSLCLVLTCLILSHLNKYLVSPHLFLSNLISFPLLFSHLLASCYLISTSFISSSCVLCAL